MHWTARGTLMSFTELAHPVERLCHQVANSDLGIGLSLLTAMNEQRPFTGFGRSSSIRKPRSVCCRFRNSNKSALVVTRILIAILISQPLAIGGSPR